MARTKILAVARVIAGITEWLANLPVVWKVLTSIIAAAATGLPALLIAIQPALPASGAEWAGWITLALLSGFGVIFLIFQVPNLWKGASAPRYFQHLPREHRQKLAEILKMEPDGWRVTCNTAIYIDLSGKGLIRDVAPLASNQVMVRLTPVGRSLTQEWLESDYGDGPSVDEHSLSEDERRQIGDLRAIWSRHGKKAVKQMLNLFQDVCSAIEEKYWARALRHGVKDLNHKMGAFEATLSDPRKLPAATITEAFNDLYRSYMNACDWIARISANGDMPAEVGGRTFSKRMQWWKEDHFIFNFRLRDLASQPEHERTLHIFYLESPPMAFERPELIALLKEVENESNYPNLIRPEASTEANDSHQEVRSDERAT